ncbi:MAG: Gfo/Idh/MocA family oxidoreductase [Christensenellaceae bacterium]
MKKITAILIGAGDRGTTAYAAYALNNPGTIEFIAVAERNEQRRKNFQKLHHIPDEMAFESWDDVFSKEKFADAVLICTNENFHYEPALLAMEKGYNILLEKPITQQAETCVEIGDMATKYDKVFMLCYVLRYTPFFFEIKRVLDTGVLGELKQITHCENTGIAHFSHSYVRGMFSKEENAGPMILSKCCHDMDILNWLTGSKCVRLSSFATATSFNESNAPKDAPQRCTDGCSVSDTCYFYAPKMYSSPRSGFNIDMISLDKSPEGKMEALANGPFGRCVYKCDNNVVDAQVINMEYENGVNVSFSMTAYSEDCYRTIRITGTKGEIEGNLEKNEFTLKEFSTGRHETIKVSTVLDRHSGGDYFIMNDFIKLVRMGKEGGRTAASEAVDSHVMCFAAEKSRKEGRIIDLAEYKEELREMIKIKKPT